VGRGATYTVDATVSVATEAELRGAGTNYPASVTDLVPGLGQLAGPSAVDDRITALATQVVAGQTTPYDQVNAIETYLRTKLKYNLQVSTPPSGQDPVIYFLFNSHVGYCEYFASAMGELVRGLGIPVRLGQRLRPGRLGGSAGRAPPPRQRHPDDVQPGARLRRPHLGRSLLPLVRLGPLRAHPGPDLPDPLAAGV